MTALAPPAAPGRTTMIRLDHVSKWFGDIVAVSDLTFELGPGVTALLGPNGAGKSTVLRLLAGLARPSQGQVRVLGGNPRKDLSLFGRIGLVPQQEGLFEPMTAREFVEAAARLLAVRDVRGAAARALELVELDPSDRRPVKAFSKGNRQRVKVAAALVHDPEVLVLDEPLNGLDPRQRVHLIDLVRRLGQRDDRCVVVSSHVLDEVERFGSRILVIAQGRLAAEGDFRAIRDLMDDRPHRLRLVSAAAPALAAALLSEGVVAGARVTGSDRAEVETTDIHRFRREVAVAARALDLPLDEVVPLDDDLDSVFRYLVGR
jgi:ABC-2 type transport system ATP-binding protein